MVPIFICEDDAIQRHRLEDIIKKYVMIEDYDMEIVLSTDSPNDLLQYVDEHRDVRGLYFLDIDLGQEMNGVELGASIRKKDIYSRIVFITTHSELMTLTFTYKVEAMDFIAKDEPESIQKKVQECLQRVNEYHTSVTINEVDRIKLKINNQIRVFDLNDVMFFETTDNSHKLKLHLENSWIELYGSLNEIENLAEDFVRIHKSYVVNKRNIMTIDQKNRELTMSNGEKCMVSARKVKLLK
ncbi:DNA-binding response regulator [Vagococcus martis]|uniref:DNA-binding response regulator n=1 Tax=Vagococcus martis TaxID=1768210 RepID=A0A1V4DHA6_9ENTE|nr:LytTR family DNA-binding domain-containing protein [Vagococcus martis]OPF87907.1 DNA-binding response regulator [Vagococcus martis]